MEIDTSSNSILVGVAAAIVGLLILILAFLMDLGGIVMALGIILVIIGAVVFYLKPLEGFACPYKPKTAPVTAKPKAPAKNAKNYGDSKLGKALTFAEQKLNDKEDSIPSSLVEFYRGKISVYSQSVGKDEDSALIGMSQVIGAIVSL